MLNSAAGVTLPSAIAPPIRTIALDPLRRLRGAGEQERDVRERPDRDERDRLGGALRRSCEEVDRVLLAAASPCAGGQVGPVEAALPVHLGRHASVADERAVGAAATGTSARPTSSRTRIAFAVVLASVWLPATVVTPSSSSSGLASASRSAIASSWPGSQSRMIGIGVMPASIASTSSAWAGTVARPGATRRSRRRRTRAASASSRSRPSSSETTRQAQNASPAAVPSTAVTGGGVARATSSPPSSSSAPSRAEREREERPERRRAERVELERVRHDQVAAGEHLVGHGRAGAAFRQNEAHRPRRRETTASMRDLELARAPRRRRRSRRRSGCSLAFAPGTTTIWFSPRAVDDDHRDPGRLVRAPERARGRPRRPRARPARGVRARRPRRSRRSGRRRRAAPPRRPGSRPCRPGRARSRVAVSVSPGRGSRSHERDEVEVDRARRR